MKEVKKWEQPVPNQFSETEKFFIEMFFFWITDGKANNKQFKFFGTESFLKGFPVTSKAASCYIGQIVRYWIKGNVSRIGKSRLDMNGKGCT